MKREEIEKFMKTNNMTNITLWVNEKDTLGMGCVLKGGILYDYTNHRFNKKTEVWGYVDYDRKGNADILDWSNTTRRPFIRNSRRVDLA